MYFKKQMISSLSSTRTILPKNGFTEGKASKRRLIRLCRSCWCFADFSTFLLHRLEILTSQFVQVIHYENSPWSWPHLSGKYSYKQTSRKEEHGHYFWSFCRDWKGYDITENKIGSRQGKKAGGTIFGRPKDSLSKMTKLPNECLLLWLQLGSEFVHVSLNRQIVSRFFGEAGSTGASQGEVGTSAGKKTRNLRVSGNDGQHQGA